MTRIIQAIFIAMLLLTFVSCEKDNKELIEGDSKIKDSDSASILLSDSTDFDGNKYNSVQIGRQIWLIENLKVTHFNNGDPIPMIQDSLSWATNNSAAACQYNNISSSGNYGLLYNFHTVMDSRGICPTGWRIPTLEDWNELIDYLGGIGDAGVKLKEAGLGNWLPPNNGNNETGFTALPGGKRNEIGEYLLKGEVGFFWTSTESNPSAAICVGLKTQEQVLTLGVPSKNWAVSVRCVKDIE